MTAIRIATIVVEYSSDATLAEDQADIDSGVFSISELVRSGAIVSSVVEEIA